MINYFKQGISEHKMELIFTAELAVAIMILHVLGVF